MRIRNMVALAALIVLVASIAMVSSGTDADWQHKEGYDNYEIQTDTFSFFDEGSQLAYTILDTGADEVEVARYVSVGTNESGSTHTAYYYSGEITVPATVEYEGVTYTVVGIGDSAFANCDRISSIDMSAAALRYIGGSAFYNIPAMDIVIPATVESIGTSAFNNAKVTSVSIEQGSLLRTIGYNSFGNCSNLTTFEVPSSVTIIEGYAFSYSPISSIEFEEGSQLTSIGRNAFYSCQSLERIIIPSSVTEIGDNVFDLCSALTTVVFEGPGPETIPYQAFRVCSNLTEVTFGSDVKTIGQYAFMNCSSLATLSLPDGLTMIDENAFYNCTSLSEVTIPDTVTLIAYWSFYNCRSFTDLETDAPVTIDRMAFYQSGLSNVVLNGAATLRTYAFNNCDLDSVVLSGETTIMNNAFQGSGLESFTYGDETMYLSNNGSVFGQYTAKNLDTGKGYVLVGDALNDTAEGETVQLLGDTEYSAATYLYCDAILDLGGHTLTLAGTSGHFRIQNGSSLVIDNGDILYTQDAPIWIYGNLELRDVTIETTATLEGSAPNEDAGGTILVLFGSYSDVAGYSHLTVGEDTVLAYHGDTAYGAYGVMINAFAINGTSAYGATVDFHGTLDGFFDVAFYMDDFVDKTEGNVPVFNIYEDATTTGKILGAGYARWNIYGSTYDADSALSIKSGEVNVYGGEFHATGDHTDDLYSEFYTTDGSGAAVSITSNEDRYAHKVVVNIEGGTFVSENSYAILDGIGKDSGGNPGAPNSYATITISGGTFIGNSETGAARFHKTSTVSISGGSFSSDVTPYCSEGKASVLAEGMYVVQDAPALTIEIVQDAAFEEGGSVTLSVVTETDGWTPTAYSWSDGSTDAQLVVSTTGRYSVTVTFEGYKTTATAEASIDVVAGTATIGYEANGGFGAMGQVEPGLNTLFTLPECQFVRTGYTFTGWNTAADGSGAEYSDGESFIVTGNVTLFAQWEPISYTIGFDANGGTGTMDSIDAVYDTTVTLAPNGFTRPGYQFTGWNTAADGSGISYVDGASITNLADVDGTAFVFYAQWAPNTYTVSFEPNGGTGEMEPVSMTYGDSAEIPESPFVRTGYTFTGWNTAADGSGASYQDGATVSNLTTVPGGEVVLYAQWTPIRYTVAFEANGGTGTMEPMHMTYGVSAQLTSNTFTRSGYSFVGWSTAADGTGTHYQDGAEVTNLSSVDGETVTLYAQWIRNYVPPSGGGGTNPPQQPETPDTDVEEHPDGSTTETTTDTTTNTDGSKTETTTVVEKDPDGNVTGSTVIETTTSEMEEDGVRETTSTTTTTTSDGEGNVTGSTTSSTVTTVTDTTTTVTEKEETSDADGNVTSSTEKITETTQIGGGTMTSETTTSTDSQGNTSTTESVRAESEDGSVTTMLDVREDGTTVTTVISGSAQIDDAIIEAAVSQSTAVSDRVSDENPSKVIQVGTEDDTAAEVTLSPGSMSAIADTGAEFRVICQTGTMDLDSDVVSTLTEPQQDVTVRMSESDDSDLTEAQIQSKGDRFGVSMTATVGDQRYHLLGGKVTVTIPYAPSMGEDPSILGVFYIDEDGVRTFMESVFDSILNAFVFQTDHFSLFVIDEAPVQSSVDSGNGDMLLYAGVVVVVIVIIAVSAVLVRKR